MCWRLHHKVTRSLSLPDWRCQHLELELELHLHPHFHPIPMLIISMTTTRTATKTSQLRDGYDWDRWRAFRFAGRARGYLSRCARLQASISRRTNDLRKKQKSSQISHRRRRDSHLSLSHSVTRTSRPLHSELLCASRTGNFSSSSNHHENTTAILSSHRFILVSRCSYFFDQLINWPTNSTTGEPPHAHTRLSPSLDNRSRDPYRGCRRCRRLQAGQSRASAPPPRKAPHCSQLERRRSSCHPHTPHPNDESAEGESP